MGQRKRKRGGAWHWLEYGVAVACNAVLYLLPHRAALAVGRAAGLLLCAVDGRHRRVVWDQLRMAFPDWPEERLGEVARQCYRQLGMSAAEFFRLGRADRQTILNQIDVEGLEYVDRARAQGRGVILFSAHLGNWELMAIVITLLGYRLHPVARSLGNPWLNRLVNRIRGRYGSRVLDKKSEAAPGAIIQALRRGDFIGILLDQNMAPYDGIFVEFFGRPACTSKGLALVARRTGAPVLPAFIVREKVDRHRLIFGPPLEMAKSRDVERDILENTARCTAEIERTIRAHPDQWLWLHRRWKTQPQPVDLPANSKSFLPKEAVSR